jgi:hypothetical protein
MSPKKIVKERVVKRMEDGSEGEMVAEEGAEPSASEPSASQENKREEEILFDIVNIPYNYNAIFSRGTLTKFEAVSHHNYLKLKMPGPAGVIAVKGSQPSAVTVTPFGKEVHTLEVEGQEKTKPIPKPAPTARLSSGI